MPTQKTVGHRAIWRTFGHRRGPLGGQVSPSDSTSADTAWWEVSFDVPAASSDDLATSSFEFDALGTEIICRVPLPPSRRTGQPSHRSQSRTPRRPRPNHRLLRPEPFRRRPARLGARGLHGVEPERAQSGDRSISRRRFVARVLESILQASPAKSVGMGPTNVGGLQLTRPCARSRSGSRLCLRHRPAPHHSPMRRRTRSPYSPAQRSCWMWLWLWHFILGRFGTRYPALSASMSIHTRACDQRKRSAQLKRIAGCPWLFARGGRAFPGSREHPRRHSH